MSKKKNLLVVIVNYGYDQIPYLNDMIVALRGFKKYNVKIVVNSNIHLDNPDIDKLNLFEKLEGFGFQDIFFKLKISKKWSGRLYDFNFLPMTCRKSIMDEIDEHDYFIYSENDHLWLEHHVDKFIEYEKILPENRIAGLIQYEFNESGRYYPGFHSYFDWDYNSIEIYDEKVFAHFNNVHQACFLISKKQLKKICGMHDFTNFMSIKNKYSIKCKVNTDIYEDCGFKKLICVSDFEENIIHHIPNLYIDGSGSRKNLKSSTEERMKSAVQKILSSAL